MAGTHLILFVIQDLPVPSPNQILKLEDLIFNLAMPHEVFAASWLPKRRDEPWRSRWALAPAERLRIRVIVEAVIAYLYGINTDDFRRITADCDHTVGELENKSKTRTFDPKGFWRLEKDKAPELRLTVLSQVAFEAIQKMGFDQFMYQNKGEGWMLPEVLRLADYGLGHDDRAKDPQPVAALLGPRFYPWQLQQSVEESWEECGRHAEVLNQLLPPKLDDEDETDNDEGAPKDSFLNPVATNLFGDPIAPTSKKR
jgi:hypothetical protein